MLRGWTQENPVVRAERPSTSWRQVVRTHLLMDYKPPLTRAAKQREEILLVEGHVEGVGFGVEENQEEIRELPVCEFVPLAVVRPFSQVFISFVLCLGVGLVL